MLFCAPKLVWDLLSRSSACPSVRSNRVSLHPSASLSVRYSVLHLSVWFSVYPPIPPFFHPAVFLYVSSVRPSARPCSFLPLFCQSIRLSVRFRFSVRVCLSVRLFIPYVDPICPSGHQSVHPFVCPSFQTLMPLSFRSSVRLTIYLFTMDPDK